MTDRLLRGRPIIVLIVTTTIMLGACGSTNEVVTAQAREAATTAPTAEPTPGAGGACELTTGPATLTGRVMRVTGGIAGIDETTLIPTSCLADPLPVINLDTDALPFTWDPADCQDCADAMQAGSSEEVTLSGTVVAAGELSGEAPGPGSLVLVADGTTWPPQPHRYRVYDVADTAWDLRTRVRATDDGVVVCQVDYSVTPPCVAGSAFEATGALVTELAAAAGTSPDGVSDFLAVRGTTTSTGRILVESVGPDPF